MAHLHATDVTFSTAGANILCADASAVLRDVYETGFHRSEDLTTFMQRDVVIVDLGYIVNSGATVREGSHDPAVDDRFGIQVWFQRSDHAVTNVNQEILASVHYGDYVSTSRLLAISKYEFFSLKNIF